MELQQLNGPIGEVGLLVPQLLQQRITEVIAVGLELLKLAALGTGGDAGGKLPFCPCRHGHTLLSHLRLTVAKHPPQLACARLPALITSIQWAAAVGCPRVDLSVGDRDRGAAG